MTLLPSSSVFEFGSLRMKIEMLNVGWMTASAAIWRPDVLRPGPVGGA